MTGEPNNVRRWLLLAAKLLVLVLVVWFVRGTLIEAFEKLRAHQPKVQLSWLVFSGVLYLLGTLLAAAFWHRILHKLGQHPTWRESVRAFMIGHLGKYVPGKAMVVVLRSGLVKGERVDPLIAAFAVFLETLTMMAVGAALGALILVVRYPQHQQALFAAVIVMLAAGVPTLPPVLRRLIWLLPGKAALARRVPLEAVTFRLMAFGWVSMIGCWTLLALSLWATLRGTAAPALDLADQFPLLVAAVAMAMVAGFVSPLPGGAVVRELVLAQLMEPVYGPAAALVAALVLRVVWLLAEVLISVILYYYYAARGRT